VLVFVSIIADKRDPVHINDISFALYMHSSKDIWSHFSMEIAKTALN